MKYLSLTITCLIFVTSFVYIAYAEQALTWKECVRETFHNHPDLIFSQYQLKQAQADKTITKSSVLPQINAELSEKTSDIETKNATGTVTGTKTDSYSYSVNGRQLLFDGKTPNDIKTASLNVKAFEYDYAVTSSNIRLKLRAAFVGLLKAQELETITTDIASRRKQNLKMVKLRYESGTEHEGALLTAQADLAQAEYEVVEAKRNVVVAQRQLIKELGRNKFMPIKVKGDFKVIENNTEEIDLENLAENTPMLKELIAKKEAAKFGVKSAKADFFPQVYLDGSIGKSSSSWPPQEEKWSVGVTMSLPIFEGGSKIAEVSKAKAEFKQAQETERSGRDGVIYTLQEAWTDFKNAVDKISVQHKYLEAAQARAKIANAEYSTGLISFDDWIIIEDNLVSTKKAFLNSQEDMLITEAKWIQAKGGTLEYDN
ncbi:MAG: TolC family protein [bacterium]